MFDLTLPAREITRSTPRTRILTLDLGDHEFSFAAGQAVFAGLADGSVRRPYSIACSPQQARRSNAIELLVQIDDHNAPDPHLELAERGTLIKIHGPFGSFAIPDAARDHPLLFIAGGTGIAPLRSMMWDALERDSGKPITVLYSARSPEEFAYADELRQLAAAGRIQLVRTVTRDATADWDGTRGRMSRELIAAVVRDLTTTCVICGPASLVADATAIVRSCGLPDAQIVTETYAP